MLFRESQNFKTESPAIQEQLRRALAYIVHRLEAGYAEVVPTLAAEQLGLPSVEVLGLLMVLEDRGVLHHHYRVYCRPSDGVLADVKSKKEVATATYCKFCDRSHTDQDLDVEVVFDILPDRVRELLRTRAVA